MNPWEGPCEKTTGKYGEDLNTYFKSHCMYSVNPWGLKGP